MPWTISRESDAIVGHQLAPSGKPPQGFLNNGAVSLAVAQLHEVGIHFWTCLMRFNRAPRLRRLQSGALVRKTAWLGNSLLPVVRLRHACFARRAR